MSAPAEIAIAAFIKRHSPEWRAEPRARLLAAVAWYNRDGRCGVLRDGGRIVAVALVRALDRIEQHAEPWAHHENGPVVWIDNIISRTPCGIGFLVMLAARRFGVRESFAGHVFNRGGDLRLINWRALARLAPIA